MKTLLFVLPPSATPLAQAAPVKIGFVLSTLQEEALPKGPKILQWEAKKLGFEPVVVSSIIPAKLRAAKVENLLTGRESAGESSP